MFSVILEQWTVLSSAVQIFSNCSSSIGVPCYLWNHRRRLVKAVKRERKKRRTFLWNWKEFFCCAKNAFILPVCMYVCVCLRFLFGINFVTIRHFFRNVNCARFSVQITQNWNHSMANDVINAELQTMAQLNTWNLARIDDFVQPKREKLTKRKRNNDKSGTFQLVKKITSNRNSFKLVKHKLANKTLDLIRFYWNCVCVFMCLCNEFVAGSNFRERYRIQLISDGHVPRMWVSSCKRIERYFLNIEHFVGEWVKLKFRIYALENRKATFMSWKITKAKTNVSNNFVNGENFPKRKKELLATEREQIIIERSNWLWVKTFTFGSRSISKRNPSEIKRTKRIIDSSGMVCIMYNSCSILNFSILEYANCIYMRNRMPTFQSFCRSTMKPSVTLSFIIVRRSRKFKIKTSKSKSIKIQWIENY